MTPPRLFVFSPSCHEPVNRAVFRELAGRGIPEAQACGRIVVGPTSGAIPETMDGQGHLFAEGDASALASLLRDLFEKGVFADPDAAISARANRSIQRQADLLAAYLEENDTLGKPA